MIPTPMYYGHIVRGYASHEGGIAAASVEEIKRELARLNPALRWSRTWPDVGVWEGRDGRGSLAVIREVAT